MKSPPELWEELSEAERLAAHLAQFGEIRITRVEPEQKVSWESEHASGTVEIEPSGWGTRVTLTAELADASGEGEANVAEAPSAQTGATEAEASAAQTATAGREPEAEASAAQTATAGPEPAARSQPEAEAAEPGAAAEPAPKRGLWARLFARRRAAPEPLAVESEPEPEVVTDPPEPEPAGVRQEPAAAESQLQAAPGAAQPQSDCVAPVAAEPEPSGSEALDADRAQAVLDGTLDALGAAHHRPYSRS